MVSEDQFSERKDTKPDAYTLAWWHEQFQEVVKGYRGATHSVNRAVEAFDDLQAQLKQVTKRCEELERERKADRAKIGQLQERVGRMADFLNAQKKSGSGDQKL